MDNLKLAALAWRDRQRSPQGKKLCEAIQTHNHPVLWLTFKRAVLNLCGLYVVVVLLLVASALAVHTTARL